MNKIQLTAAELKEVNGIKEALLTDSNATTSSQSECYRKLAVLAEKYNVTTQVIYDSATYKA